MARSKSTGSVFSVAAREHPKTRLLVAVKGNSELVWWPSSASSLEDCSSHVFKGANVFSILDHKKFDEVVVCLADGQVVLFNLGSKSVVSQIGEPKSKLRTVWSGVYSLSKIAHVLLVVEDEEQGTHHLRVIRMTSKRLEEKDTSVLEHVCVHLLLEPEEADDDSAKKKKKKTKKKKGSSKIIRPGVASVAFDASGLTLSCLWRSGALASYRFLRTKHLVSLELNLPPKAASNVMHVGTDAVASAFLVAYRQHHVCLALSNVVAAVNTMFGAVVSSGAVSLEDGESAVAFIAASNDSFFLMATQRRVFRINLPEPESALLSSCIDSAGLTERLLGPQKQTKADQIDFVFSVVNGKGTVTAESVVVIPESSEALSELLAVRCTPGVGFVLRGGAARPKDVNHAASDVYTLTPEFAAAAAVEFASRKDWTGVSKIVQAHLLSIPPKSLVVSAIAARQTSLLQALARCCSAMSREDLAAILVFSLSPSYVQNASSEADVGFSNQLLLSVVEHQRCPARLDLQPSDLQTLLTHLASMAAARSVLSAVVSSGPQLASILDWMSCVIDSCPQAFVLDPKMAETVSALSKSIKIELENAKMFAEIGVAADVVKHHLIPAVSTKDQSQLYSIEFLSLAD